MILYALGKLSKRDQELIERYLREEPQEQIIREMQLRKDDESEEQGKTRFRRQLSRAKAQLGAIGKKLRLDGYEHSGPDANQSAETPRTEGNTGDGKVDAEEVLVKEILARLPLTRLPRLAHSDAVAKHTDARKDLIRAVLRERNASEGPAYEDAVIGLQKAKDKLTNVYGRKLYKAVPSSLMAIDFSHIKSLLNKQLVNEAAPEFAAQEEERRAMAQQQER